MSSSGLPDDLERFIADHIYSVEQLEVLLLLQRTKPREWTARQVADELRTAASSALMKLDDLTGRSLLTRNDAAEPGYSYGAGEDELDRLVVALAGAYSSRRITVIQLIFSKPIEKMEAMRAFADAFRVRK